MERIVMPHEFMDFIQSRVINCMWFAPRDSQIDIAKKAYLLALHDFAQINLKFKEA